MADGGIITALRSIPTTGMVRWTATNQPGENFSKFSRQAPQGILTAAVKALTAQNLIGKL
eukprot:scaffold55322_cov42-Prasinocladus_malaysianus.AAC.3